MSLASLAFAHSKSLVDEYSDKMGMWYAFGIALFAAFGTFLFVSRIWILF